MDQVTVWNARLGINHCSRWAEFGRKVFRNIRYTFTMFFCLFSFYTLFFSHIGFSCFLVILAKLCHFTTPEFIYLSAKHDRKQLAESESCF